MRTGTHRSPVPRLALLVALLLAVAVVLAIAPDEEGAMDMSVYALFAAAPALVWFATEPEPVEGVVRPAGLLRRLVRLPFQPGGASGAAFLVLTLGLVLGVYVVWLRTAGLGVWLADDDPMQLAVGCLYGCVYVLVPTGLLAPLLRSPVGRACTMGACAAMPPLLGLLFPSGPHGPHAWTEIGDPWQMIGTVLSDGTVVHYAQDDLALLLALAAAGILLQVPRVRRSWRTAGTLGLIPVLVLACAGGADDGTATPAPRAAGDWSGLAAPGASAPDTVVLLSLDTLRADHLSLYGYARPTSPVLEGLAARGRVYENALSAAPWTLPSHASLFTGLYPHEHGAHTILDPAERQEEGDQAAPLAEEATTLAEVLGAHGYRTGAVVANIGFLGQRFQLDQGFEQYDARRGIVDDVTERALAWLDGHQGERVFLFVNTMDTHRPYNCVPRAGFTDYGDPKSSGTRVKRARRLLIGGATEIPPDLRGEIVEQYDTAIANLEEGLGRLFDGLRARGRFEDALIVVTSDHGEFLGEHALIEHSKDVYQPVLHVPLIVRPPGGCAPERDTGPISGVHVAGIVLSHCGIGPEDAPDAYAHWPRAAQFAENYATRAADLQGAWAERLNRVRRTLVDGRWKYVDSSDGAHELFDLARDPGELENLLQGEPERAAALSGALRERAGTPRKFTARSVGVDGDGMSELGYAGDEKER